MNLDQVEAFMAADPVYFDHPHHAGPDHEVVQFRLPDGWSRRERGMWTEFHPPGPGPALSQGWKIHIAATADRFHDVVRTTATVCLAEGVPFKTLANTRVAMAMNSKYAPRTASGKAITVYPESEAEASHLAARLDTVLDGDRDCPRILTDVPYRAGPVHLRYGAFRPRLCVDTHGDERPAIVHPDGTLTPDERTLLKPKPEWVELPDFLHDEPPTVGPGSPLAAYQDIRALHFSNGGGVYRARHAASGVEVILKEARPFCGHDGEADATQRVHQESVALGALDGVPGVPRFIEEFEAGGHLFSVREYVPGIGLTLWSSSRHPRITGADTPAQRDEFRQAAAGVMRDVRAVLRDVHRRGYVYRDLHPHNVIIGDDGAVSLIDFEMAVADPDAPHARIGHPPFMAPPGTTGVALDEFSADALHTWLLVPYVGVDRWGAPAADAVLERARTWYDLSTDDDEAVSRWHALACRRPALAGLAPQGPRPSLVRGGRTDASAVAALRVSLTSAEDAAATPRRADRLFPGHPSPSSVSALSLASGAAGVLHARLCSRQAPAPEWVDWLERSALRQDPAPAGLWNGMDGVALVLARAGRIDTARTLLGRTADLRPDHRSLDFANGLAGISLVLREVGLHSSDEALVAEGRRMAELVAAVGADPAHPVQTPGLLHGRAGMALMALHWSQAPHDGFAHAARDLLSLDVDGCVDLGPRGLFPREGRIFYPYLGNGSAGLAVVAHLLAGHAPNLALPTRTTDGLARAITPAMVLEPGLIRGRAGLLAAAHTLGLDEGTMTHLGELPVHLVDVPSGRGIPSIGGLRLAHDLATGTAGLGLALAALADAPVEVVPFLMLARRGGIHGETSASRPEPSAASADPVPPTTTTHERRRP
ncbi:class III lanthionine synthetase [Micrococcus sp. 140720015-1]